MKRSVVVIIVAVALLCGVIAMAVFRKAAPPTPHRVVLTWHPPAAGRGIPVVSFNVYRSTTPGGPYVKLASGVSQPTYEDSLVNGARTYYYVVTSVDATGHESRFSAEVTAAIP